MIRSILVPAWLIGVLVGMGLLAHRDRTPAAPSLAAPERWPSQPFVSSDAGRFTLVMSLHPRCFCSRSTLHELSALMARAGGRLNAHVLMVVPTEAPSGWEQGTLWDQAAAIPGVSVATDNDGRAARAFGASISGQVAMYDPLGHLVFAGGITASRGHEGDNDGVLAILALLANQPASVSRTPVYGCALEGRFATPQPEGK